MTDDAFARAANDAATIAAHTGHKRHDVAIVLGSGWTRAAEALGIPDRELPFADLSAFPAPTVAGHEGSVASVAVGDRRVLLFNGRVHLYEGHDPSTVVHGVRTAVLAGCSTVILTNAAGSLHRELAVGSPVVVSDHVNLTGHNPLAGAPPPAPNQSRFVDMTRAYAPALRELARRVDPEVGEGVYAGLQGPSYETPAEVRMLQTLGADVVGMSTVLETIAAVHLGAEVLGIALVTNLAAGLQDRPLSHAEVVETGRRAMVRVGALLRGVVERL